MRGSSKLGTLLTRVVAALTGICVATAPMSAWAQRGKKDPPEEKGQPQKTEIILAVGENKTIPANDVRNYSEGTPGVVDVKLTSDQSQFVVVGLKPGATTLLLIKKNGQEQLWTISVFQRSPEVVEAEVAQLLDGYTGIRLRRVGSRLFIEGGVNSDQDLARIKQIAGLYPGQVESLVGVGSGASDRTTNIRVDFYFVRYDRTKGYAVGIDWPTRIGGAVITSNAGYDFIAHQTTAQTNIVNQPLPALDIASNKGWAKVSKQATVITTNGTEARFQSGGEQNFPIAAGLTGTLAHLLFGATVVVLPRFDPQSRDLELKVDAEIADLSPPVSSTTIPGRNTSHLTTLVRMKLGQSLVLSGIHTRSERHNVSGLPLLSEIPVLGVLFGSHKNEEEEVDGAIFVVPSVVDSSNRTIVELVNTAMQEYEDYSGNMKPTNLYKHMPPTDAPAAGKKR